MNDWLSRLHDQAADASTRLTSAVTTLGYERQRISRSLDQMLERLGHVVEKREKIVNSDLHQRVLSAFEGEQFEDMSLRERRYAARRFELAQPAQMQKFLDVYPESWATFAAECFRRWDDLARTSDRGGYERVLRHAPPEVEFMHGNIRAQELAGRDGPQVLAGRIRARGLVEAKEAIEKQRFDASWSFSSSALAVWAWLRSKEGYSFSEFITGLRNDVAVEAMVLPRRRSANGSDLRSWFSETTRPPRVRVCTYAQAVFLAALFRSSRSTSGAHDWGLFSENLLRSDFGDPRIPPQSDGWTELQRVDQDQYQWFLELLISEDLEVFFDHAMQDTRRRRFWLSYLKSVRRTACVLEPGTYARLNAQFAGGDKKLSAALGRARQFNRRPGSAVPQAFCLYFDSVVVVEFSLTGNAAFIYSREDFEKSFEGDLRLNRLRGHDDLKRPNLCVERLIHSSHGWEETAEDKLMKLGVFKDPPVRRGVR